MTMDGNLSGLLKQLMEIVIAEAEQNDAFAQQLAQCLTPAAPERQSEKPAGKAPGKKRRANRRDPAVLDPIDVISQSEDLLLERLSALGEKELKDIIADYGMDSARRTARWKKERLIDLIVSSARQRSTKGDAFRMDTESRPPEPSISMEAQPPESPAPAEEQPPEPLVPAEEQPPEEASFSQFGIAMGTEMDYDRDKDRPPAEGAGV